MAARVLVVGASLAGLRAAEQLRAAGWDGLITVAGAERHLPYNRPPLSKEILRRAAASATAIDLHGDVALRLRDTLADVEWRLGSTAAAVALDERTVIFDDGEALRYDGLVVATGLRPRRLAHAGAEASRYVLRTLDDACRLGEQLSARPRVVVVGGGLVGAETAATARELGCEVTVVFPDAALLDTALGTEMGAMMQARHEAAGIHVRPGRSVVGLQELWNSPRQVHVTLDGGEGLEADVVIEAIGSLPNVEWLAHNGLDLSDGVLCDSWLRIEGRDDAVAVGDVARFPNLRWDAVPRRVEHWATAGATARRAARTLVAHLRDAAIDDEPFTTLPSFWTDQLGLRVQGFGLPALADSCRLLEGSLSAPDGQPVVGYFRGERIVGAVLAGAPAQRAAHFRSLLLTGAREGDVLSGLDAEHAPPIGSARGGCA